MERTSRGGRSASSAMRLDKITPERCLVTRQEAGMMVATGWRRMEADTTRAPASLDTTDIMRTIQTNRHRRWCSCGICRSTRRTARCVLLLLLRWQGNAGQTDANCGACDSTASHRIRRARGCDEHQLDPRSRDAPLARLLLCRIRGRGGEARSVRFFILGENVCSRVRCRVRQQRLTSKTACACAASASAFRLREGTDRRPQDTGALLHTR